MKKARNTFLLLNLTWGLPMNVIGGVVAVCLLAIGKRPERYGDCWCFTVGKGWGGVSFGLVMVVAEGASKRTKNHEHGHAVQNALFGVLMPFAVSIPSATRYWHRRLVDRRGKANTLPPYDSAWFEGQATRWGTEYIKRFGD